MKINLLPSILLLGTLVFSTAWSQDLTGAAAGKQLTGASRIRMNEAGTAPVFVWLDASQAIDTDKLKIQLFGTRPEDQLVEIRTETDEIGMTHARFQQQYKHVNVDGHVYIFHSRDGKLSAANGYFAPNLELSVTPSFSEEQALDFALNGMKQPLAKTQLETSTTELVVLQREKGYVLAYKCGVFSNHPLVNQLVYVDANSGKVLREDSRLCAVDAIGTGHTQFSGNHAITTDNQGPTSYLLRESGRGNGIETLNVNTDNPYTDTDNDWNNVNGAMDEFATDVHFGAEATYDFYFDHFGRNSYDNLGGVIRSYVNDQSVGVNAYWSGGGDNTMHYGNGDSDYFPVASLEVAGHELTHGITEYSAGLEYQGESGALNESFSDIFGNTIRFLSAPGIATWYIGDQILRPGGSGDIAFRNMSNPNEFQNPDTYGGLYFNSGDIVHFDSGIQNFWYYLLVEGGTGTNDISDAYTVNGIGMDDAMRIAYRNLAFYLTPTATFMDARDGSELAAADLFGPCSPQHIETVHAWYAVGIGTETPGGVEAGFSGTNTFACAAPLTAAFASNYVYDTYTWNFGDGATSTAANPSHTYSANGNYTVTLIVSNSNGCGAADTVIIQNAVVVGPVDPVAAFSSSPVLLPGEAVMFTDESLYAPTSWEWNFDDGGTSTLQNPTHTFAATGVYDVRLIVHNCGGADTIIVPIEVVDFIIFCETSTTDRGAGVIFDSGGENNNYQDFENCSLLIQPCNANSITITVNELAIEEGYDFIYVYDGTDNGSNLIGMFNGYNAGETATATSGSMYIQFNSDGSVTDAGFKMTYTSQIVNTNNAAFTVSPTNPVIGQAAAFTDQSQGNPLSWSWNFGDGGTSSNENPFHTFTSLGTYTVTLSVMYCNGLTDLVSHTYTIQSVGINELTEETHLLTVAPNPFREEFVLAAGETISNVQLRILDLSGRAVFTQSEKEAISEGITVSPALLSNGQYLLEVRYERANGTPAFERCKIQVMR